MHRRVGLACALSTLDDKIAKSARTFSYIFEYFYSLPATSHGLIIQVDYGDDLSYGNRVMPRNRVPEPAGGPLIMAALAGMRLRRRA